MSALAEPEEVRAHLVAAARAGAAVSYGVLLEQLGYRFTRPKMRALCATLARIDDDGAARGEPGLAVLVVRQSDGLPGQGWWVGGIARERGYEGPWEGIEARRFVARVQAETFAYWKSHGGTDEDEAGG